MYNSINNLTFEIASSLIREFILDKNLKNAKKNFIESKEKEEFDPKSSFEKRRDSLLLRISKIRSELILKYSNYYFYSKLYPLLINQNILLYEASSDQELNVIRTNLDQVEGYIAGYEKLIKDRSRNRKLALYVSLIFVIALILFIYFGNRNWNIDSNTIIPILMIPLPVLLWSAIGSFASILYRFNNSGDFELQDSLRWLITRPIIGIVMGIISFFILRLGFLAGGISDFSSIPTPEAIWLVAFISGFSDKFADSLLRNVIGKFTGEITESLIINQEENTNQLFKSLRDMVEKGFKDNIGNYNEEKSTKEMQSISTKKTGNNTEKSKN